MRKKPFGAGLDFYDGQWYIPFGLLALSTLYWDYEWTKVVSLVMYIVVMFHIMYEHRIAFGKKDVGMRLLYNLIAFIVAVKVTIIMPVYMAVSYSIFASKLKRDKEDRLLEKKKNTFVYMTIIMTYVIGVNIVHGLILVDDVKAAVATQQTVGVGGVVVERAVE